jgi:hypothetical protein
MDHPQLHHPLLLTHAPRRSTNRHHTIRNLHSIANITFRSLSVHPHRHSATPASTSQRIRIDVRRHHTIGHHCQSCAVRHIDDHSWSSSRSHARSRKILARSRWHCLEHHRVSFLTRQFSRRHRVSFAFTTGNSTISVVSMAWPTFLS